MIFLYLKKEADSLSCFEAYQVSSLQRIFLNGENNLSEINSATALKGERFSYQIAYKSNEIFLADIIVDSELKSFITVRTVENVPSEVPIRNKDHPLYIERAKPGLFPDVLSPICDKLLVQKSRYHSVMITVELPSSIKAGKYPITVFFKDNNNDEKSKNIFTLEVIDAALPEQKLIYTQWFHCDSIANYYNVPVFSEKFWSLTESFMRTAVHTGVNMILTPLFTPPLDTAIGGERLTVQLVDVSVNNGKYIFDFEKLISWIRLALNCGFKYFEMSHLFSQWGAVAAPKIIARVNGEEKRIFGWETDSSSPEYSDFLKALLPELINVLRTEGIADKSFFHISDEPSKEQVESYSRAKNILAPLVEGFPIIDALSDYEFYRDGIVSRPIPCTSRIESFIEQGFEHPWTYYCCGQEAPLSNRFFGMPLAVTRAIGVQLYKSGIEGFLQWGYNFYNSQQSLQSIDPYRITDAGGSFPSGDAFTVYPGKDMALESIRSEAFYSALQDMRALQLLEKYMPRDEIIAELENAFGKITFTEYPKTTADILKMRAIINNLIKQNTK